MAFSLLFLAVRARGTPLLRVRVSWRSLVRAHRRSQIPPGARRRSLPRPTDWAPPTRQPHRVGASGIGRLVPTAPNAADDAARRLQVSDVVEQRFPGFPRELDRRARPDDLDALAHPRHGRKSRTPRRFNYPWSGGAVNESATDNRRVPHGRAPLAWRCAALPAPPVSSPSRPRRAPSVRPRARSHLRTGTVFVLGHSLRNGRSARAQPPASDAPASRARHTAWARARS